MKYFFKRLTICVPIEGIFRLFEQIVDFLQLVGYQIVFHSLGLNLEPVVSLHSAFKTVVEASEGQLAFEKLTSHGWKLAMLKFRFQASYLTKKTDEKMGINH